MSGYNPQSIEKKWQQFWATHKTFATPPLNALDHTKPKYYVLDMFPYPSGQGLHVGHPEGYTATDIVARYKRAAGFNVMHPMGWDAFGLPAEQYAIKNNVHPRETTANNINRFRQQLQSLGFSYDWDREVDTTDPTYYKWTQWIFLKLYDTWFDEEAQRGRPISELIEEFKSRARPFEKMKAHGSLANNWVDLSATDQRAILANYRLAYEAEVPVNWCPGLGTVLANEEVIDGKSEVGGFPVERRPMKQWMLRITAYSERLLNGLDKLEWTDSLKEMQRNWIGKSEGAEVEFELVPGLVDDAKTADEEESVAIEKRQIAARIAPRRGLPTRITVFTTRPDTLFGATYLVLAPEHPLVSRITDPNRREKVDSYRQWAASRSDRERQEDTRKTGEFTGAYATNPVSKQPIPIFISDYVLMGYGTGAIMAVPAHDERDHEFATKFKLPIVQVVAPKGGSSIDVQKAAFTEEGLAINSPSIEGLPTQEAKSKMIALLEEKNIGKRRINYKIRDWLFSRQRYWGEPFPLVHLEDGTTVRLADDQLPLRLPDLADFKPTGTIDPPLSKATDWNQVHVLLSSPEEARAAAAAANKSPANPSPGIESLGSPTVAPCGVRKDEPTDVATVVPPGTPWSRKARRELNTMPQWAGSCWYFLRYLDPKNPIAFADPSIEKYWMHNGVDLYVGGVEHAVLHLLYSRFWYKVLFDWGLVTNDEPFRRLVNQGMILGENNEKMSKSRGNVVTSDSMVEAYGADALRLFEMFMGPLEQVKPWSTAGVEGVYRFLQRVWRNLFDENDQPKIVPGKGDESLQRPLHRLIKKITDDIERLSLNTAIAGMMEFNNLMIKATAIDLPTATTFLRLLEPFAPHFAEEAYEKIAWRGNARPDGASITHLPWPTYDPAMLTDTTQQIPIQINGKLKSRITIPTDADEPTVLATALADPEIQKALAGQTPKKKIYIKGRMVNLVV